MRKVSLGKFMRVHANQGQLRGVKVRFREAGMAYDVLRRL
jgi:hypothetical protein